MVCIAHNVGWGGKGGGVGKGEGEKHMSNGTSFNAEAQWFRGGRGGKRMCPWHPGSRFLAELGMEMKKGSDSVAMRWVCRGGQAGGVAAERGGVPVGAPLRGLRAHDEVEGGAGEDLFVAEDGLVQRFAVEGG